MPPGGLRELLDDAARTGGRRHHGRPPGRRWWARRSGWGSLEGGVGAGGKLKRLARRGRLTEDGPGLFAQDRPAEGRRSEAEESHVWRMRTLPSCNRKCQPSVQEEEPGGTA